MDLSHGHVSTSRDTHGHHVHGGEFSELPFAVGRQPHSCGFPHYMEMLDAMNSKHEYLTCASQKTHLQPFGYAKYHP